MLGAATETLSLVRPLTRAQLFLAIQAILPQTLNTGCENTLRQTPPRFRDHLTASLRGAHSTLVIGSSVYGSLFP